MFCDTPFTTLVINTTEFSTCCSYWLRFGHRVGKNYSDPWKIWNHPEFVSLRDRMLKGDFSQCVNCPKRILGACTDTKKHSYTQEMGIGPKMLILSDDLTCNLACWSCRSKFSGQISKNSVARDKILHEFSEDFELISLLHSGDPFYSDEYLKFILEINDFEYPNTKFQLFTNGNLLPKYWDRMKTFRRRLKKVMISIDAGTKTTYEKVRRGGDWTKLNKALSLIQGEGTELETSMTVSTENFEEIPQFIQLSRRYRASLITVKKLLLWWQSEKDWMEKAITEEKHPRHKELLGVLNSITDVPSNLYSILPFRSSTP